MRAVSPAACAMLLFWPALIRAADPVVPTEPIVLFDGRSLAPFYTYISDTLYEDPQRVFSVVEAIDGAPAIRISGEGGFGGLITKETYANYHLVAEFRWGELTWGNRRTASRDSGILLHGFGPDGGYNKTWLASIECQIIEGGVGDFLAVPGVAEDGSALTPALSAEVHRDRDGEPCYQPGGEPLTIHAGRVNWYGRDPDWQDLLGYRGPQDVESPHGEWTRVECICRDATIELHVNGTLVNRATDCYPTSGKLTFQTEGAEIYFRRIELLPLAEQSAGE